MEQQRVVHQSPKRMWGAKLGLRIPSAIFDLVLIGISASLGTGLVSPALVFFIPPACVSLIWNIAEGICILARGGHRGIHPGACVGVDLVLWLGFCTTSILYILFGYGYGWYYYSYRNSFASDPSSYSTLNRACIAFGFLETIIHFALFVIACCETSIRNRAGTVLVYQHPPPGMMLAPGYHPQSMAMPPGSYHQQHHQSMVIPQSYQPPPQGYQGHMGYAPQNTQGMDGGYAKHEADSTPVSDPTIPSPVYEPQPERRT